MLRERLEEIWDAIPAWVIVVVFSAIIGVAALGAFVWHWYPVWVFYIGLGALAVGGLLAALRQVTA
jgi:polyferredoxin